MYTIISTPGEGVLYGRATFRRPRPTAGAFPSAFGGWARELGDENSVPHRRRGADEIDVSNRIESNRETHRTSERYILPFFLLLVSRFDVLLSRCFIAEWWGAPQDDTYAEGAGAEAQLCLVGHCH